MTIQKWLLATAIVALLPITSFAASSDDDSVAINGSVAVTCTLGVPTQVIAVDASLDAGATSTSATLTFPNIADPANAQYTGFGDVVKLKFAGMCNYAATLGIQTTGGSLVNSNAANVPVAGSLPFADKVNYQASAAWNGTGPNFTTNGTPGLKNNHAKTGALLADIDLTISLDLPNVGSGAPMLAGDYTDTMTIQVGAAL